MTARTAKFARQYKSLAEDYGVQEHPEISTALRREPSCEPGESLGDRFTDRFEVPPPPLIYLHRSPESCR